VPLNGLLTSIQSSIPRRAALLQQHFNHVRMIVLDRNLQCRSSTSILLIHITAKSQERSDDVGVARLGRACECGLAGVIDNVN
jgi:hypothetical protein